MHPVSKFAMFNHLKNCFNIFGMLVHNLFTVKKKKILVDWTVYRTLIITIVCSNITNLDINYNLMLLVINLEQTFSKVIVTA